MINILEKTLASIVTENNYAVPVLEKYDLDFCCRGKRTLLQACAEKGVDVNKIIKELQEYPADNKLTLPFSSMRAEQLISYILMHHHLYVKQSMPMIANHLEKVSIKHGDHFPYMTEVLKLFREVEKEMTSHMQKEELLLFPRIKNLELLLQNKKGPANIEDTFIYNPIKVMEAEHDHAGDLLAKIRKLTNSYDVPAGACTTFRISLAELKEFEEDLHRHVHLENNLLFPLADKILKSLDRFSLS